MTIVNKPACCVPTGVQPGGLGCAPSGFHGTCTLLICQAGAALAAQLRETRAVGGFHVRSDARAWCMQAVRRLSTSLHHSLDLTAMQRVQQGATVAACLALLLRTVVADYSGDGAFDHSIEVLATRCPGPVTSRESDSRPVPLSLYLKCSVSFSYLDL